MEGGSGLPWSDADFVLASTMLTSLLQHKGYLMKKGEKNTTWRRRFFTLGMDADTGRFPLVKMYYYENEGDRRHINYVLLGPNTDVKKSVVGPPKSPAAVSFVVSDSSGGGRSYHLAAESEDEQIRWVIVLRKVVRVLQQREQQGHAAPTDCLLQCDADKQASEKDAAAVVVPKARSKAERLLQRDASSSEKRKSDILRASLDLIVERASGLEAAFGGKKLAVRVACINAATSIFTWWEYCSSEAADVAEGCAEWHADFSYEGSGVGTELVFRVVDSKEAVVAEARMDTSPVRAGHGQSGTMTVALPLRAPLWEADDVTRGGGVLREDDVLRQGGKRDADELRGCLHVRLAYSSDASTGMLCRLGVLGDPIPLRLQSGDVLLFSQSTGAARITKIFTWSKWSHAAIVIRRRNGFLSVLEATGDGVNLYELDNVWWRYHKIADIGVCRLMIPNGLTDEDHEKLYTFVETLRGRPYEKNLLSLVGKVSRSRSSSVDLSAPPKADNELTQVFCSELVAAAYRAVGLLGPQAQLQLLPKHFDTTEASLHLERGARLFPPRLLMRNPDALF